MLCIYIYIYIFYRRAIMPIYRYHNHDNVRKRYRDSNNKNMGRIPPCLKGHIGLLQLDNMQWASPDLQAHMQTGAVRSLSFDESSRFLLSGGCLLARVGCHFVFHDYFLLALLTLRKVEIISSSCCFKQDNNTETIPFQDSTARVLWCNLCTRPNFLFCSDRGCLSC